jgi:hypothetical protein
MAYSAETQGFNFSIPSLAGITAPQQEQKPFALAGATPLQIKPLAGWSTPSSQPELVGKGIAEGIGQIGKGISVAYAASQEAKKDQYKRQQDMQKYALDIQREKAREHHDDAMILASREKTLPFSGQFAPETSVETPNSAETPASTEQATPAPVKGTEDNKITPVGVTYVPNTDALNALTAATQQPLSQISKYVSAGNEQGPVGTPELPVKVPQYTGVDPTATNKITYAPKNPEWRPYRNTPQGYEAAVAESKRHYEGYQDAPEVVEDPRSGGWKVARKHSDEIKSGRYNQMQQRMLDAENGKFNSDNSIKNFTSATGMQQNFPKFMRDYEENILNPKAGGISQIGLLDMYARAEGGGRITEGQAALALHAASLKDKFQVLFGKPLGGDILGKDQIEQMMNVVAGDHATQVRIANQKVTMARNRLQKQGITAEEDLPQYFIEPKLRSWHNRELDKLQNQAGLLIQQKNAAKSQGKDTAPYDDKLMMIADKSTKLQNELDAGDGDVLNMHELENTPQGWGGASATALIQQNP